MENYKLMSKDTIIANIVNGIIEPIKIGRLPLYLQRTGNFAAWLKSRAIDSSRVNSRLLKKALRLDKKDDVSTVLSVNAATITDNYWVRHDNDDDITYKSVRFDVNRFDMLALLGDVNYFNQQASRTPELTNIGSFEKCWTQINGNWWMIKSGNAEELFSELLIYHIGLLLGFSMAQYQPDGNYIKSLDFTNDARVDFEPAFAIIGDESDYIKIYEKLKPYGEKICISYIQQCYLDALVLNMDRHEFNYGLLRDSDTGEILSFAPFFDHNIALISRGYPKNIKAENDLLITDYVDLLTHTGKSLKIRKLTEADIDQLIAKIPWNLPATNEVRNPHQFVKTYLLNRQLQIEKSCNCLG